MITDMRDSISSWPVRIVLLLLIISFISFYGGKFRSSNTELKQGEVAVVNGDPIHTQDFSFQYQNLIQSYQKQGRLPADVPESIYGMLKQQLLASMIYQKLKASEANHVGFVPSDDKVKEVIKKQFSDAENKFDFKFYEGFLRNQMGKTPGQYEELQRENIRADMFEQLLLETGSASNLQLKNDFQRNNEKVILSYVKVNEKNTANVRPKAKAGSTEELQKYYNEHQDEFKTKEYRKLDIAYFDKNNFSKEGNFVKDAESLLQNYSTTSDLNGAAAKDARLRRVTTGLVTYGDTASPLSSAELTEVLNSTQNLDIGKSTVLVSRDGNKVFLTKLMELQASKLPEFASVRTQVEKSFELKGNSAAYDAWVQSTWTSIASNAQSLDTFAKKMSSAVKDTESFAFASTNAVPSIGTSEEVMTQAFALSKDKPYFSKPVKVGEDYVFIKLKDRTEPDWKKFETDHDNLANVLDQQNAQTRFVSWMDNVEKHSKIKRELPTGEAPVPMDE
jgi:parvulin-like peptidyl-prolyl isomerase